MNTTITWTTKTGQIVTATPDEHMPATWLHVTVGGKAIADGHLVEATDQRVAALSAQLRAASATHVLVCGKTPIAIQRDIAEQIKSAQQAAVNQPATLKSHREILVTAIQAAGDQFAAERELAFGADSGRGWDKVSGAEAAIKAAEQALADFDTLHPEIAASLDQERREAAERFARAD